MPKRRSLRVKSQAEEKPPRDAKSKLSKPSRSAKTPEPQPSTSGLAISRPFIESMYKQGRMSKREYEAQLRTIELLEAEDEDVGDPRILFEPETEGDRRARERREREKKYKREHPSVKGLTLCEKPRCGYFRAYTVDRAKTYKDPDVLLDSKKQVILDQLRRDVDELNGVKSSLGIRIKFTKTERDGEEKIIDGTRVMDPIVILKGEDPTEAYDKQVEHVRAWIELFTGEEGSGVSIDQVGGLYVNIAKYEPIKGSSYIKLPPAIRNTGSVINVNNDDNRCLVWAIKSAQYPKSNNPQRVSHYVNTPPLNMDGVNFPTPLDQIPKVEKQNKLAINVYGYSLYADGKRASIFPYYISNQPYDIERINLLLTTEIGEGDATVNSHYCWIKNLNRLLVHQTKMKCRMYYCDRCLYGYAKPERLEAHKEDCRGINECPTAIKMPPRDNKIIRFKNHHKQLPVPYVIYADLEALIEPMDEPAGDQTRKTSKHVPCGFCYKIVRYDGKSKKPVLYRGPDAIKRLIEKLKEEVSEANYVFSHPVPLKMTPENKRDHNNATECWICEKPFEIHSKTSR